MEAICTGLAQSTQQSIPNRLRNRKPHPQSMPCRFAAILFVFSCGAGQGLVRGVSRKIRLLGRQFATPELDGIYYQGGNRWISFDAAVCLDRRRQAHFSTTPWQRPEPSPASNRSPPLGRAKLPGTAAAPDCRDQRSGQVAPEAIGRG